MPAPSFHGWTSGRRQSISPGCTGCDHPCTCVSFTPTQCAFPLPLHPSFDVCHCLLSHRRPCNCMVRSGRGVVRIPRLQRLGLQLELPLALHLHDTFDTFVIILGPPRTTHFFRCLCVLAFMSNPLRTPHVCIDFLLMRPSRVLANSSTPSAPPAFTSALPVVQRSSARPLPFRAFPLDRFVFIVHMHIHYSLKSYFSPSFLVLPLCRLTRPHGAMRMRMHLILHTVWQACPAVLSDTLACLSPTPSSLLSAPNALALTRKVAHFLHSSSPSPLPFPHPPLF